MRKFGFIILIIISIVILFAVSWNFFGPNKNISKQETEKQALPTPSPTLNLTPTSTPAQGEIQVQNPKKNEKVGSPFIISGRARAPENTIYYRLKNAKGQILVENYISISEAEIGEFGNFEKKIWFETVFKTGTLELFIKSEKDGEETDLVIIPLQFS